MRPLRKADLAWVSAFEIAPPPAMPSTAHGMMIPLIMAEDERKLLMKKEILPEGEVAIREASLCGDQEPLVILLWDYFHGTVKRLEPETWNLVIEYVSGKRNPKTGRLRGRGKGKGGRRKQSWAEKHTYTPTHDAEAFVPVIRQIVGEEHPDLDIDYLADEIAKRIKKMKRSKTVTVQRNRGPNNRHRARRRFP